MRLSGKHAIVTGAGSGSAGRSRSGSRARAPAWSWPTSTRTAPRRRRGHRSRPAAQALAVQVDVSDRASVDALLGAALARFEQIDILFNNAGVSSRAPFLEMTEEEWDRVLGVNLKGQFLVGQAVARHMAERGGGAASSTPARSLPRAPPTRARPTTSPPRAARGC